MHQSNTDFRSNQSAISIVATALLRRGRAYLVEIKTPAGELSDPQQSVMAAVLASGGRVGVVRDAEEMLGLLDAWGIPRARRMVLPPGVAA
jgi:hypothetical protein